MQFPWKLHVVPLIPNSCRWSGLSTCRPEAMPHNHCQQWTVVECTFTTKVYIYNYIIYVGPGGKIRSIIIKRSIIIMEISGKLYRLIFNSTANLSAIVFKKKKWLQKNPFENAVCILGAFCSGLNILTKPWETVGKSSCISKWRNRFIMAN